MPLSPEDLQATFCATLVDEWARCGVSHAVVSPGSRSTPMALALVDDERLRVHVHHDERSAAFLALGLARALDEAVIVLTTSGTAAVELHPAVVEADLSCVPLLICTADRPPELVDVGAPQAIDQVHLYGRSVRWFHAPGVADAAASSAWRTLAARAHAEATGSRPGPVHLNLAFREPLVGSAGELPGARASGSPWVWRAAGVAEPVLDLRGDLAGRRGVLVAGEGSGPGDAVHAVATALGWPVLASPSAPVWSTPGACVRAADPLLRVEGLRDELRPEVVVHLGRPVASRVVGEWLVASGASHVVAAGTGRWVDPHGVAAAVLDADPAVLVEAWAAQVDQVEAVDGGAWLDRWCALGRVASAAVADELATADGPTEPGAAAAFVGALPEGTSLVVSSSMPIRDLEWYVEPMRSLDVHANRGANGIDGVVSTAVGVALGTRAPAALLIGDVAFLHDTNGLLGAGQRGIDLVVLVVDNDGGGIFSFLPQADVVEPEAFERLYGTPHGLDLAAVARSFGANAQSITEEHAIAPAVEAALAAGGVQVLVVRTERAANRGLHAALNEAVAAAVDLLAT